jgi:hypothetical protein
VGAGHQEQTLETKNRRQTNDGLGKRFAPDKPFVVDNKSTDDYCNEDIGGEKKAVG